MSLVTPLIIDELKFQVIKGWLAWRPEDTSFPIHSASGETNANSYCRPGQAGMDGYHQLQAALVDMMEDVGLFQVGSIHDQTVALFSTYNKCTLDIYVYIYNYIFI